MSKKVASKKKTSRKKPAATKAAKKTAKKRVAKRTTRKVAKKTSKKKTAKKAATKKTTRKAAKQPATKKKTTKTTKKPRPKSKSASRIPPEAVTAFDKVLAAIPGVERKGAASAYTSVNGNMFSFLTEEGGIALRMAKDERQALLDKGQADVCIQYNTVMKDYALFPLADLKRTAAMTKRFKACYAYAKTLPAKATTKKK